MPAPVPPVRRPARTAVLALCLVALTATACRPEFRPPLGGTPEEFVGAAIEELAGGAAFSGSLDMADYVTQLHGDSRPADDALALTQTSSDGLISDVIRIGDELWLHLSSLDSDLPDGWGHFAEGGGSLFGLSLIGPESWPTAVFAVRDGLERSGPLLFTGAFDAGDLDTEDLGLDEDAAEALEQLDGDGEFTVRVTRDGHLESFRCVIDADGGDFTLVYNFTDHGAVEPITPPDGEVTELSEDDLLTWLMGA